MTFLPVEVVQKLLLSVLLFFSGVSMTIFAKSQMVTKYAFLAGLLYMFNPFVAERFASGQWLVFAGYAFLPLILWLFIRLLSAHNFMRIDIKQIRHDERFLLFAFGFAVYFALSMHFAYIALCLLVTIGLVFMIKHHKVKSLKSATVWYYFAAFIGIVAIFNSYWLTGFFNQDQPFPKISLQDFYAYKMAADSKFGPFFTAASLYGFWDKQYFLTKDLLPYWWILSSILMAFAVAGAVFCFIKKHVVGIALSVIFIPMLLVAVGVASGITEPLIHLLFHIPGFKGLRETTKLISVLALAYAILIPLGIRYVTHVLANIIGNDKKDIITLAGRLLGALVILGYSYSMLFGYVGQMQPARYPASWYQANQLVEQSVKSGEKTLILPWHGYVRIPFAGNKQVANPAPVFFSVPVIYGQNIDNAFLLENEANEWEAVMFTLLNNMATVADVRSFLDKEGVAYIVLLKVDDWQRYGWLGTDPGVKVMYETEEVGVYGVVR